MRGARCSRMQPSTFIISGCCATFLVSRERVLARSKAFYEWLFHWVLTTVRACCLLPDALPPVAPPFVTVR